MFRSVSTSIGTRTVRTHLICIEVPFMNQNSRDEADPPCLLLAHPIPG